MRYNFDYRFIKKVLPNTVEEQVFTPLENCVLELNHISGSAPYISTCHVELLYGEDIIFSTHGDKTELGEKILKGIDGKNMTLRLVNSSENTETLGITLIGNKHE